MVRKPQKGPALINRDQLERAHFTLQASVFLQELSASASSDSLPAPEAKGEGKGCGTEADFARLAQNNMRSFRRWTAHNLVNLDPSVKHALCTCNTVLVPGLTASVRVRPSAAHGNIVHTTCGCGRRVGVPAAPWGRRKDGAQAREGGGSLDGPVRGARRARLAHKAPFHRRERVGVDDDDVEEPTKKKKKKGKGKVAGPLREGHVLWAGRDRVSGWGVTCDEPQNTQLEEADSSQPEAPAQVKPEPQPKQPNQEKQKQQSHQQKQADRGQRMEKNEKQEKALTPEELEELANNG
ncbi:hypothetical protein CspHIS471_0603270 [Cutaneotrichosporon sp. HIS471]|nr:hypothetical protein CspHIS471_0603270 [Cutaneotrichosporon sp. HIS471]